MAQVNIELSHDCNMFELKIHKKCDELYKDFEKRIQVNQGLEQEYKLILDKIKATPEGVSVENVGLPFLVQLF